MAKKVKRKIKKEALYAFAGFVTIIVITILGINYYNDYQYQKTYEFKFIEKGYSKEEADILQQKLSTEKLEQLLSLEKEEQMIPIITEKYFIESKLEEYLNFQKENQDKSTYDIVAMVNVHANKKWYEEIKETNTTLGNLLLVNKFNQLPQNYTPENLVEVSNWYSYGTQKITKETYDAFINLFNKAKEDNINFFINSSYRDQKSQEATYESIKKSFGTTRADNQAARPGHSEHESGYAFDIFSPGSTSTGNFQDSEAYSWLKEHAHLYGFIERYPKGKEYITGYNYESWHWRYVGIEVATKIKEEEITFDEYYAYYIENQT